MTVVVATYNVHRCIGADGRHDPDRVAAVIRELDADIVGLQEVDSEPALEHGLDQVVYLAAQTGLVGIAGPTLRRHDGAFGNALLTRRPVRWLRLLELSVPRCEPRGAIVAELDVDDVACRVVVTHLGLRSAERRRQLAQLLAACTSGNPQPTVLLGDLNEWLIVRRLLRRLPAGYVWRAAASFPSWLPLLRLDGILACPGEALTRVRAHRSPTAFVASDHLPVRGELRA